MIDCLIDWLICNKGIVADNASCLTAVVFVGHVINALMFRLCGSFAEVSQELAV